jgi:hypothetical protein
MTSHANRFRVGVLKRGQGSFGELTLAHGRARLDSWPLRRSLVLHTSQQVRVVRPRIDLFGRRSVFVLEGDTGAYGVRAGLYPVQRLENAFLIAGFNLLEQDDSRRVASPAVLIASSGPLPRADVCGNARP